MALFSKPIAAIYVKELRKRFDPLTVPMFTPDTKISVGDFGTFEGGRFVRKGNVFARGVTAVVEEAETAGFDFATADGVTIGPSVTLPGGLLRATVSLKSERSVLVSLKPGREATVADADHFAEELKRLWLANELPRDRAVVWSVRYAQGGTVIASEQGDNAVDVSADSALLGPLGLTLPNLAVGVQFGTPRNAMWTLSQTDHELTFWIRLLRLEKGRVDDAFGFEPGSEQLAQAAGAAATEPVPVGELLAQLE